MTSEKLRDIVSTFLEAGTTIAEMSYNLVDVLSEEIVAKMNLKGEDLAAAKALVILQATKLVDLDLLVDEDFIEEEK